VTSLKNATPAPACHHCDAPAEHQHQRHLTQAEYDGLGDMLKPIDGRATLAVLSCGDHALPPYCTHTMQAEQPCPTCHAPAGQACTKGDGTERLVEHPARAAAKPKLEMCRHAHREDCAGYGACHCTPDDAEPEREPRIPPPDDRAERAAHLQTIMAAEEAWLEQLVAKHGGDRDKATQEAFDTYNAFMADHDAKQVEADRREIPAPGLRQIGGTP
jgi:hypothetical protein